MFHVHILSVCVLCYQLRVSSFFSVNLPFAHGVVSYSFRPNLTQVSSRLVNVIIQDFSVP